MKTLYLSILLLISYQVLSQGPGGQDFKMPQYPGGREAMAKFIRDHVEYPEPEQRYYIQGRVVLSVTVDEEGHLTDAKVKKSVSIRLDAEALRLVRIMPDFIPASNQGHHVKATIELPIRFRMWPENSNVADTLDAYIARGDGQAAYLKGMSCKEAGDYANARDYFLLGAELHNVPALYEMAYVFIYGKSAFLDYDRALVYLNEALDSNSLNAQVERGFMYEMGWGSPKDKVKAEKYYRIGAERGNRYSQTNLGLFYRFGTDSLPQNDTLAVKWFRKAALQGYDRAQYQMGIAYENGRGGLPADTMEALRWFDLAAQQHHSDAQNTYAWLCFAQNRITEKAVSYIQESVAADTTNMYRLDTYAAVLYAQGKYSEAEYYQHQALLNGADTLPDYLERYGNILLKLKRKEDAKAVWQKALALPDHSPGLADKISMRKRRK